MPRHHPMDMPQAAFRFPETAFSFPEMAFSFPEAGFRFPKASVHFSQAIIGHVGRLLLGHEHSKDLAEKI